MMFQFTRRRGAAKCRTRAETPTFRVARISREDAAHDRVDISHLIDRTYDYRSPRELRWHLAERFGLSPDAVGLREAH